MDHEACQNARTQQSPTSVEFVVGNTYRRLNESEASYDMLTQSHLRIHDWVLYIDVLPGSDADIIDRVMFEMRDKSFITSSFTCHSPIRIRSNVGSAYLGKISGAGNSNNSQQEQIGQDTEEKPKDAPSMSSRPHHNQCRWRFSTKQQTYGPVDVRISIRGRGGTKLTIPSYIIVLQEGGNETYPTMIFVEKRPNMPLKPMKMMDVSYMLKITFCLDQRISASSALYESAKSVFSRSKIPIRVLSEDGNSEEFGFAKKKSVASTAWSFKLDNSSFSKSMQQSREHDVLSIFSPRLNGGHGLNECYKVIEGLPWHCDASFPVESLYVRIDVSSTLSLEQLVKLCQNFIKYEESMDSFMPTNRRGDHCCDCKSNKQHVKGESNKERNYLLSKCKTVQELVGCINPSKEQCYKLNLSCLVDHGYIEFRHHESSKDKTTVTNWIRFCAAFVKNSARLRSPLSLKETTSIEEEFDLLFEYVVKDRALRNFYRDRKGSIEEQERERQIVTIHG
jgi:hypothetical protein